MDLSAAEKFEFIRTLWLIAQCFVDDAFSGGSEASHPTVDQLKAGFAEANVIDSGAITQTRAATTNDNTASCAKGSTDYEVRTHERQRQ